MKEIHSTEDLKNFICESKPDKDNIIEGYPFSGKKHLLYETLDKLKPPFFMIYHKDILSGKNQGKELKKFWRNTVLILINLKILTKLRIK